MYYLSGDSKINQKQTIVLPGGMIFTHMWMVFVYG